METGNGDKCYRVGDEIMVDLPWVWALDTENIGLYCENCFVPFLATHDGTTPKAPRIVPVVCRGCSSAFYCSLRCLVDCSKQLHNLECSYLKKFGVNQVRNISRRDRCVILALLKATTDTKEQKERNSSAGNRTWESLLSHWSEFRKDPYFMRDVTRIRSLLQIGFADSEIYSSSLKTLSSLEIVGEALGKFATNSFTITDSEFTDIGCGIYLAGSIFDHSCVPNASKYFKGKELHVYALREITDLSQVRISYIFLCDTDDNRKRTLREDYHFECNCQKCDRLHPDEYSPHGKEYRVLPFRCQNVLPDGDQCTGTLGSVGGVICCDLEEGSHSIPTDSDVVVRCTKANEELMNNFGVVRNEMTLGNWENALKLSMQSLKLSDQFLKPEADLEPIIYELYDRAAECARQVKDFRLAAVFYAKTLPYYVNQFPDGSFEVFVQFRRYLRSLSAYVRHNHGDRKSLEVTAKFAEFVTRYINYQSGKFLKFDVIESNSGADRVKEPSEELLNFENMTMKSGLEILQSSMEDIPTKEIPFEFIKLPKCYYC